MKVGDLDVTVLKTDKGLRLKVLGSPYGVETSVTPDDLLRVAQYLKGEAEKIKSGTENGG